MPKFRISYPKEINNNLYKKDFNNELGIRKHHKLIMYM